MTVATVGPAIATVQEGITGVTAAYAHDELPGGLQSAQLPAFLNFPDAAEYTMLSHSYVQEIREWRMWLLVAPLGRDQDPGRMGGKIEPYFRRTYEAFLDSIQLEGLADIVCVMVLRDTGWSVLTWSGIEYIGIEFILQVTEKFTVTNYSA